MRHPILVGEVPGCQATKQSEYYNGTISPSRSAAFSVLRRVVPEPNRIAKVGYFATRAATKSLKQFPDTREAHPWPLPRVKLWQNWQFNLILGVAIRPTANAASEKRSISSVSGSAKMHLQGHLPLHVPLEIDCAGQQ